MSLLKSVECSEVGPLACWHLWDVRIDVRALAEQGLAPSFFSAAPELSEIHDLF